VEKKSRFKARGQVAISGEGKMGGGQAGTPGLRRRESKREKQGGSEIFVGVPVSSLTGTGQGRLPLNERGGPIDSNGSGRCLTFQTAEGQLVEGNAGAEGDKKLALGTIPGDYLEKDQDEYSKRFQAIIFVRASEGGQWQGRGSHAGAITK